MKIQSKSGFKVLIMSAMERICKQALSKAL